MHRMQSGEYALHAARIAKGTEPLVTKTGKELSNLDIQLLADEAERGYDVSHLVKPKGKGKGKKSKGKGKKRK